MLDWVIRGGTVIDGSGGAPFRADIGIRGGKIAAVGSCGEAAQTLDAAGRYVTPGFLDIHRHGDAAVFRPGFGRAELRQGLTSIVNGNCGLSLAPFGAAHRAELRRYLGAITGDIDPAIPTESMAAYLDALRARPLPLHVGMLVGGGTVRADCCGYAPGDADEALPELHRRLERALADGALGVSLGLGYAPECFYTPDGLLRALAPLQGSGIPICVHMRATRKSPMPVADPCARPTSPVKPRSKTRGTSAAGIPQPSSRISSVVHACGPSAPSSRDSKTMVVASYFAELMMSWVRMNASQALSATTVACGSMRMSMATPHDVR